MKVHIVVGAHCMVLLCVLSLLTMGLAGSKGSKSRKSKKSKPATGYNVGDVLSFHIVISRLQCEELCLRRQPQCLGYNYHFCEEHEKQCQLLKTIGKTDENECVTYVKFRYGKVRKRLLEGCSCSKRNRPI